MNEREVMKQALEALENAYWPTNSDLLPAHNIKECAEAITALRQALEQPADKPVAWANINKQGDITHTQNKKGAWAKTPLYTRPQPAAQWVGLTDEEKVNIAVACGCMSADWIDFAKAIEQALKEKNTCKTI